MEVARSPARCGHVGIDLESLCRRGRALAQRSEQKEDLRGDAERRARESEAPHAAFPLSRRRASKGSKSASVSHAVLASTINTNNAQLPENLRYISLNARHVYVPPHTVPDLEKKYGNLTLTYALQTHIAVLEIDPDTCKPQILDYAIVDDCGTVINHKIVEGQVHGAAAHAIGAALHENLPYDEDGNLLAGSFTDYTPMTILNMPHLKYTNMESPSPFTFNGAKGMGEGGGAPVHAISAAVQDALFSKGIIIRNSHHSPMGLFDYVHSNAQEEA